MRQHIYKKHATADPLAARLPYGLVTRQLELIGWKRLEMNRVLRFEGVSEEIFESIFRRGWVCVFVATFLDEEVYKCVEDPESKGVFKKDPTLKTFL